MDIRNDRQKGLNYTEIGKKYHLDPRTAKRYALSETKPAYQLSGPKPSILDPYKHQIDQWLEEAPYSAVKILEKPKEQDYQGKYTVDLPPEIVPNPMLGIPIWGGVSLAPLDRIVPLGGVAVKGGVAVPFTLDGQAAKRYPPSKRRKG